MTEEEALRYTAHGYLPCPKCGSKMRQTLHQSVLQGWDDAIYQASRVVYTGDKSKPTQTIEQPPPYRPSEVKVFGIPVLTCNRCSIRKMTPEVESGVEWARRHMLPARGQDTIPWEVVVRAMAEQHISATS